RPDRESCFELSQDVKEAARLERSAAIFDDEYGRALEQNVPLVAEGEQGLPGVEVKLLSVAKGKPRSRGLAVGGQPAAFDRDYPEYGRRRREAGRRRQERAQGDA